MNPIYLIHKTDAEKLEAVKSEMLTLGAPTVRVVDCGDHYMAIEGTHRLAAAADLGIEPNLIILDQDDMVEADSLDMDYFEAGRSYTAGEIAGELHNMRNPVITF
jgi:hypothetical protein